jgi:DNA repair ATPase RecN
MNTSKSITLQYVAALALVLLGATYIVSIPHAEARETKVRSNASTTIPRVDNSCVSEAVAVREDALMSAWDNYQTDIKTALTERKTSLVAAWNLETVKDRTKAVKAAWKVWKSSSKTVHNELRNDRKSAWNTFKQTVKADCKMNLPQEEALEKSKSDTVTL